MRKQTLVALSVACMMVLIGMGYPSRTTAEVNINVGISLPPPPPLAIPAPPPMFVIPRTYVYFAPGVDVDIFYYRGYWYRPRQGHWYRSGGYNGKWVYLSPKKVPSVLLSLPPDFRRVPPGYRHIPYRDLKSNWRSWEKNKHWEKHGGREWHGEQWEHDRGRDRDKGSARHGD
jgi:hypothetical protein